MFLHRFSMLATVFVLALFVGPSVFAADDGWCHADTTAKLVGCVEEGARIQLTGTTFELNAPLELPGDIVIRGKGRDKTVLHYTGQKAVVRRINNQKITKIVIRDLALDGGSKTDSEDEEVRRNHRHAAYCLNIDGANDAADTKYKGRLANIEDQRNAVANGNETQVQLLNLGARNCRIQGIYISDVNGILIKNLRLHHNGVEKKFHHNMYLRRVYNVYIDNVESFAAASRGLNLAQVRFAGVKNYVARHNGWDGIRLARAEHVRVENSAAYGNKRNGMVTYNESEEAASSPEKRIYVFPELNRRNYNISIVNSSANNNDKAGFYFRAVRTDDKRGTAGATLKNSSASGNGGAGCYREGTPKMTLSGNSIQNHQCHSDH